MFNVQNQNYIITDIRWLQYYNEIVQFYIKKKEYRNRRKKKPLVGSLRQIFLKFISVKACEQLPDHAK